ncbi:hypothetical protein V6N11_026779 [Hibiscus sabdariffa]|uniref:Uncharacterized protein n=1 Tax=Hibiscus sabdariffa TaxID=183260 RepID=A0ABR2SX09_9ROSI
MGLSDHNVQIARDRVNGNGVSKDGDESSSESFVESVRRSGPKNVAVDGCFDEVEGVNAILIGKDYNDYVGGTLNLGSSQFGDFVSGNGPSWVEVVTSNILEDPNLEARQLEVSTHLASALDNVRSMGLGPGDVTYLNEDVNVPISERLEDLVEMEQNENNLWKQTSIKHLRLRHWLLKNQRKIIRSDYYALMIGDVVRSRQIKFHHTFQNLVVRGEKETATKSGLLLGLFCAFPVFIAYKVVPTSDDSDLQARWDITTKEAKKVIETGKVLGVHFIGPEEVVIREIASLEVKGGAL